MKSVETAVDDRIVAQSSVVVGTDTDGTDLTIPVIADRLAQIDAYNIMRDAEQGDYMVIAEILEGGFRGYHNMSPGELWMEWKEHCDTWHELYANDSLPWELSTEDPLCKNS